MFRSINKDHIPIEIKLPRFSHGNSIQCIFLINNVGQFADLVNSHLPIHNFSLLLKLVSKRVSSKVGDL